MYFITFYFYIISELQFYIIFNILLDNEVMETSKRRSFLPLIFIIKWYYNVETSPVLNSISCVLLACLVKRMCINLRKTANGQEMHAYLTMNWAEI